MVKVMEAKKELYYSGPRKDLLEIFPEGIERVLDVGCASELLGKVSQRKRGI